MAGVLLCFERPRKTKKNARMSMSAEKKRAPNKPIEPFVVHDTLSWMAWKVKRRTQSQGGPFIESAPYLSKTLGRKITWEGSMAGTFKHSRMSSPNVALNDWSGVRSFSFFLGKPLTWPMTRFRSSWVRSLKEIPLGKIRLKCLWAPSTPGFWLGVPGSQ